MNSLWMTARPPRHGATGRRPAAFPALGRRLVGPGPAPGGPRRGRCEARAASKAARRSSPGAGAAGGPGDGGGQGPAAARSRYRGSRSRRLRDFAELDGVVRQLQGRDRRAVLQLEAKVREAARLVERAGDPAPLAAQFVKLLREALNALVWLRVGDQADARIARPVREALGSIDEALGLHAAHCRAYDLGLIYSAYGSLRHRPLQATLAAVDRASMDMMPGFSANAFSRMMFGLGLMKHLPSAEFLRLAERRTAELMPGISGQQLASILLCWGHVQYAPQAGTWEAILDRVDRVRAQCNSKEICIIMWALTKLGAPVGPADLRSLEQSLCDSGRLQGVPLQGLKQLLESFVASGSRPTDALLDLIEYEIVDKLRPDLIHLQGHDLSFILSCYAKMGSRPGSDFLHSMFDDVFENVASYTPRAVGVLLWSLGTLQVAPEGEVLGSLERHFRTHHRKYSALDLASFIWGAAKLDAKLEPSTLRLHMEEVLAKRGELGSGKYNSLNQILYAYARLEVGLAPELRRFFIRDFDARLLHFDNPEREVATALWSFARLGMEPATQTMERVEGVIAERLDAFSPQGIFNTLWAFTAFAFRPSPALLGQLALATCGKLEFFKASELAMTYWSFAKLKHHLPQAALGKIQAKLLAMSLRFSLSEVSCVLYGASCMGAPEPLFLQKFVRQSFAMSSMWTVDSISILCFTLGLIRHHPGQQQLELLKKAIEANRRKLTTHALGNILWGFARLKEGFSRQSLSAYVDLLSHELPLAGMEGQELANVTWALSWHAKDPPASLADRLGAAVVAASPRMTASQFSGGLISLSTLRWSPTQAEVEALAARDVFSCTTEGEMEALGLLAWAFARLDVDPGDAWVAKLSSCVLENRRIAPPRCITNVFWFLAKRKSVPSAELFAALQKHFLTNTDRYSEKLCRNYLWAASALELPLTPQIIQSIAERTQPSLASLTIPNMNSLLRCFLASDFSPEESWMQAFEAACMAKMADFDGRSIAILLRAYTDLGREPEKALVVSLYSILNEEVLNCLGYRMVHGLLTILYLGLPISGQSVDAYMKRGDATCLSPLELHTAFKSIEVLLDMPRQEEELQRWQQIDGFEQPGDLEAIEVVSFLGLQQHKGFLRSPDSKSVMATMKKKPAVSEAALRDVLHVYGQLEYSPGPQTKGALEAMLPD